MWQTVFHKTRGNKNKQCTHSTSLKAYGLVPEAYRQRFRSAKKETKQTHVEFGRVQEQMLDKWLSSKNTVNNEFKQPRQLVLIEQFKNYVHAGIKTHLDKCDINNLEDAKTRRMIGTCLRDCSQALLRGPDGKKSHENFLPPSDQKKKLPLFAMKTYLSIP